MDSNINTLLFESILPLGTGTEYDSMTLVIIIFFIYEKAHFFLLHLSCAKVGVLSLSC